ncbi:MAG: hypothetical protein EDM03_10710 [Porphyrobacter sp. IPPAS B-1204]|nr:MAG: hypothetical protein EDM03_10710 [Porphyrobacter sp. IPPAS B-1204]
MSIDKGMVRVRLVTSLLLAASLGASATAVEACVDFREYDETAFLEADLIFVGELTDYELVTVDDHGFARELAVLTYEVNAVLKGKAGRTIRLWWPNSTFGYPPAMPRHASTVVAAIPAERNAPDGGGSVRYPSEAAIRSLPMVHQIACSPASIFPAGPARYRDDQALDCSGCGGRDPAELRRGLHQRRGTSPASHIPA